MFSLVNPAVIDPRTAGPYHSAAAVHARSNEAMGLVMQTDSRGLGALCEAVPSHTLIGDSSVPITGIACHTDLGDCEPGVLFVPLDLPPARAATVAARAIERGAAALLLEQALDFPVAQVIVPSVRAALAQLSAAFYDHPARELGCIGITGTVGKTTTTLLLDNILRAAGLRPGLIGTLDWRIGCTSTRHQTERTTPEAPDLQRMLRQMVDAGDRWAILETSSQGLALNRLDGVPFAIGAMTYLTQDHLHFHGSIAAYRRAKANLFERVAANGDVAILNADDPAGLAMADYAEGARILSYSAAGRPADVQASVIESGSGGTRFTLSVTDGMATVTLPLLGEFNVANALCAAASAHAIGVPLEQITHGLDSAAPVPGLLSRVERGQPFLLLIDEAKSAPALVNALEAARQLTPDGRIIAVVSGSDLARPGVLARKGEVAALAADYSVFTTQRARFADPATLAAKLAMGARAAGGVQDVTFACVVDRREAMAHALRAAQPGDCVVLTGKGVEDVLTVGDTTHAWDEAAIAREILADMGYGE